VAACSLALVDQDGERLEFVAAAGAGAEQLVGMRIPAGQGIVGWVLASGQPIQLVVKPAWSWQSALATCGRWT
jgi:signal transduction protein with GAF and PtsI domain